MPLLCGEGGEKAWTRLQHEIMKQSNDDSIFAWTTCGGSLFFRDAYGPISRYPKDFNYLGFAIRPGAAALTEETDHGWKGISTLLAPASTTFEVTKSGISLTAPILRSGDLPRLLKRSKGKIYLLGEQAVRDRSQLLSTEISGAQLKETLDGTSIIAALSCFCDFGRVGIVLRRGEDGTYYRIHDPPLVGVQMTELPQTKTIKIQHRNESIDVCVSRKPSNIYLLSRISVGLSDGIGYVTAGTYELDRGQQWRSTSKATTVIVRRVVLDGRLALLYSHQGGDPSSNPDFVLAFRWSGRSPLKFAGVIVSNGDLAGENWAKNFNWETEWRVPGATKLLLEEGRHVDVKMRKARDMWGESWYVILSLGE